MGYTKHFLDLKLLKYDSTKPREDIRDDDFAQNGHIKNLSLHHCFELFCTCFTLLQNVSIKHFKVFDKVFVRRSPLPTVCHTTRLDPVHTFAFFLFSLQTGNQIEKAVAWQRFSCPELHQNMGFLGTPYTPRA